MIEEMQEILDLTLADIGVSVRTMDFLGEVEVYTVEDVLNCTPEELLRIPYFGPKALEEVYGALEKVGFYRRPESQQELETHGHGAWHQCHQTPEEWQLPGYVQGAADVGRVPQVGNQADPTVCLPLPGGGDSQG